MNPRVMMLLAVALAAASGVAPAGAQGLQRYALKNGETIDLGSVWYVANCHSIMIGLPEIEVLDGPGQVKLAIREESVLPRRLACANKVPGGIVTMTATDVAEKTESKLTYRVKYKTKDGDRQVSRSVIVALFP